MQREQGIQRYLGTKGTYEKGAREAVKIQKHPEPNSTREKSEGSESS